MATKKTVEPTGMTTREPAVIVMSGTGLSHRSSVDQIRGRFQSIPDPRSLSAYETLWGTEQFTGDQVRKMIVDSVAEGISTPETLRRLTGTYGRMPAPVTVKKWEDQFPDFRREMSYAKSVRGDLMADAATEIALSTDPERANADKVTIANLQWQASKLNRETYGESKSMTVDINANIKAVDEKDLDRRILEMLRDPEIRGALSTDPSLAKEVSIIEGEVLSD